MTQAALAARRPRDDAIEIAAEDADVVRLFLTLSTQWRHHPMAGMRLGIDYLAIAPTAAMMGIDMTPSLFDDLRLMEGAAMAAMAR